MSEQWSTVVNALESLAAFFERIDPPTSGGYFREISTLIQQGRLEEVASELTGLTLWGGSGSYIDRVLYPEDGYSFDSKEFGEVNEEYTLLLFRLADALKRAGLSSYWLDRAYETLCRWASHS